MGSFLESTLTITYLRVCKRHIQICHVKVPGPSSVVPNPKPEYSLPGGVQSASHSKLHRMVQV